MKASFLATFFTTLYLAHSEPPKYAFEIDNNRTSIQVGDNVQIGLSIRGTSLLEIAGDSLPDEPQPREWSKDMVFSTNIGYEPKSPGIKEIGPFEIDFQGEHLTSNSTLVEVKPRWPRDANTYEFCIFPRRISVGEKIRVIFRQQYSGEPFFESDYNNPRNFNSEKWSSTGGMAWKVGEERFDKTECYYDITTTRIGKLLVTRDILPPMPNNVTFSPIEIDVVPSVDAGNQ